MPRLRPTNSTAGFTLIEMLIIAPLIILMIAGFIGVMINMTGKVLIEREQNEAVANTQAALNRIENDVRLTGNFQTTTGAVPSPMGSANNTAAFTNTNNRLLLYSYLTTRNPTDRSSPLDLIYKNNSPNSCTDSDPTKSFTYNEPFVGHTVYYVTDGTLYRRTIVPNAPSGGLCGTPWQRNSCASGYVGAGACRSLDEKVLENVTGIAIRYYDSPDSSAPLAATSATQAQTIEVTLTTHKTTAGTDIDHNATLRATRLNSPPSS